MAAEVRDATQLADLLGWFAANGGTIHESLEVYSSPGAGAGLRASTHLDTDQVLLRVPPSLLIWRESAYNHTALREVFDYCKVNKWVSLLLVLLHIRARSTRWDPYCDILPRTFHQPMCWPDDVLERLRGSALHTIAVSSRDEARRHFCDILQPHLLVDFPEMFPPEQVTLELFVSVLCLVYSRAFDVNVFHATNEKVGEDDHVLAPIVCFINHAATSSAVNANVAFSKDSRELVVTATRPIEAGDEVLISYDDDATAGDLLKRYGFLPDVGNVDAMEIEQPAELVASVAARSPRHRERLARAGINVDEPAATTVLPRKGRDFPLFRLCLVAEDDDVPAAERRFGALLRDALAAYEPYSLEDDRAQLDAVSTPTTYHDDCLNLCLRMRLYERGILQAQLTSIQFDT